MPPTLELDVLVPRAIRFFESRTWQFLPCHATATAQLLPHKNLPHSNQARTSIQDQADKVEWQPQTLPSQTEKEHGYGRLWVDAVALPGNLRLNDSLKPCEEDVPAVLNVMKAVSRIICGVDIQVRKVFMHATKYLLVLSYLFCMSQMPIFTRLDGATGITNPIFQQSSIIRLHASMQLIH